MAIALGVGAISLGGEGGWEGTKADARGQPHHVEMIVLHCLRRI
jgi:hypothetical protein